MATEVRREHGGRRLGPAVLVGTMFVAAYLAIAAGLFYAGMAALGQGTLAEASVRLSAPVAHMDVTLPCVEGWSLDTSSCEPAASPQEWEGGQPLPVRHGGGFLASAEVDPGSALLATAASWGGLVAGGVVGLVLIPALRSTAAGRPFAPGHARRLVWAAITIIATWLLATAGDYVAAFRIIDVIEATPRWSPSGSFDMPAGWLAPASAVSWWPLLLALLLLALAAATHRGTRLTSDTEGLV